MRKNFNQKSFTFFTINYIVGFGFIATITGLIQLGFYGLLVFFLTALITFGVSLVFSRLSNEFPNEYGGTYAYGKKVFNRHVSFFIGWNQYIQGPILSSTAPLFLANAFNYLTDNKTTIWIIQFISILFFVALILISTLGLKLNKKIIFITSVVKWFILAFSIALALYLAITTNQIQQNFLKKEIRPYLVFSNVISFMYAFGGIEDIANMSNDVKFKNFRHILMYAFSFILSLYFIFYLILLFVNSNEVNDLAKIYEISLGTTGLIMFIIGLIFNSISSRLSISISTARKLVSMTNDGFLFKALSKENKHHEYKNAIWFNAILTIVSLILFWVLPQVLKLDTFFTSVINIGSIAFLLQYFITFLIALIANYQKIINKIKLVEKIIYYLVMIIILATLLIYLFPFLINEKWNVNNTITICSYFGFILFGYLINFITIVVNKKKKAKLNKD